MVVLTKLLLSLITVAALLLVSGCMRCRTSDDCGDGSYCSPLGSCAVDCYTDQDCRHPTSCSGPTPCPSKGRYCTALGFCRGTFEQPVPISPTPAKTPTVAVAGWDTPAPGYGTTFILNSIGIALPGGSCASTSCGKNGLSQIAPLVNPTIAQGLLEGDTLILMELAGLSSSFNGTQTEPFTVKMYGAVDANDTPADNFAPLPGTTECCTFEITPESLSDGEPTARTPARAIHGLMNSTTPMTLDLMLRIGAPPYPPIRLENALIQARIGSSASSLKDGLITAAIPIATLASISNPYCHTAQSGLCPPQGGGSSVFELLLGLTKPDVDLNGDGITETFTLDPQTGRVAKCMAGSVEIMPTTAGEPWTCANRAQDGYSVGLDFSARPAVVVGLGS
jgi:hypothetical protein